MKIHGKHYRTIWPHPDNPGTICIIDQRRLPHEVVVEQLQSLEQAWLAIREMHVRGAGLIGATAGFAMHLAAVAAGERTFSEDMRKAADYLMTSRPTARNLGWAVERVTEAMNAETDIEAKRRRIYECAMAIADEDADFCRRIGEHGKNLIADIAGRKKGKPVNILTHCNAGWLAFVDYGSATAPIYAARDAGIEVHVWVDETRPWNQGAKLTAWELAQENIAHTLITDNAGGHLMQQGEVDLVLVGSDRTTHTGHVANKIGTYLKALAARDNDIPFYVALPSSTIDWRIDSGSDIAIEIRTGEEISRVEGVGEDGTPCAVWVGQRTTPTLNCAFDVTPARLVTGLITERGITRAEMNAIHAMFANPK